MPDQVSDSHAMNGAFGIVESQVFTDSSACFRQIIIGPQIDFLIFNRPPQALDKDVVTPGTPAGYADRDFCALLDWPPVSTGQLA